jgi:hypothetical protein
VTLDTHLESFECLLYSSSTILDESSHLALVKQALDDRAFLLRFNINVYFVKRPGFG